MYALRTLAAPGSLAAGYHRGDWIEPAVVENWNLVEGEDFAQDRDQPAETATPMRPADDTDRGAWVAWALANGVSPEDADNMQLDELMDVQPAEGEGADDDTPERPATGATKAEWALWALGAGADESWVNDSATTKANLMAYEPQTPSAPRSGDPVAEAATEQANG